jgi:hypothetical protein
MSRIGAVIGTKHDHQRVLPEIGLLRPSEVGVERIAEEDGGEARQHGAKRQQRHDAPNPKVHGFHAENQARENTVHHHPASGLASVRGACFGRIPNPRPRRDGAALPADRSRERSTTAAEDSPRASA